jgi:diacylglycerol kinase (ATP)
MSPNFGARGFRHLGKAFGYSVAGFRSAVRYEAAFRQEVALFLLLAPVALWLGGEAVERALLLASLMLVLVTELLNSAIEAAVDRVGEEFHPVAGRAKDLGSAAVFLALMVVAVVWGLLALPALIERL